MPPTKSTKLPRENRWLLVVSSKRDCRSADCPTVVVVILSAQVEYAGRHDELPGRRVMPDGTHCQSASGRNGTAHETQLIR